MFKLIRSYSWLILIAIAISTISASAQTKTNLTGTARWDKEIAAFEASDRTNPPPKGAILFVGSSSIRKWANLAQSFPGKQVINRGFGGSEIADSTALADRIIFPYAPKIIVFYAGDNDLASGKTPEKVFANFHAFVKKVHVELPDARIAYISIKPCPLRWKLKEKVMEVNQKIAAIKDDKLTFIDVYPAMLGPDGLPRKELFLSDGLHPSAECYALWAKIIKPYLE